MILSLLAVSCNKEEPSKNQVTGEPEVFEVKLGMSGAITSEIGPLTKDGEVDQLIAVNVWSCPEAGDTYSRYAYGLFDTYDNITVSLVSGYKYKFDARACPKGKTLFAATSYGEDRYCGPFDLRENVSQWPSTLDNTFHYDSNKAICSYFTSYYSGCELFMGETSDYIPTSNGTVTIDMDRYSFGLNISIQNFTAGSIMARFNTSEIVIEYPSTSSYAVYNMSGFWQAFINPNYYEDVTFSAELHTDDNAIIPLGSATVRFMPNKLTKVRINATAPQQENALSFLYSDTAMIDDPDDTYDIGGGEIIETPIN